MISSRTLIVGIGSPHGDDQAGWLLVDTLAEQLKSQQSRDVLLHRAASPADLLTRLDGIERLMICDACRGLGVPGRTFRWQWPRESLAPATWSGTHDLSLPQALALAEQLDQLPPQVIVWGVAISDTDERCLPGTAVSDAVVEAVRQTAARMQAELARPGV